MVVVGLRLQGLPNTPQQLPTAANSVGQHHGASNSGEAQAARLSVSVSDTLEGHPSYTLKGHPSYTWKGSKQDWQVGMDWMHRGLNLTWGWPYPMLGLLLLFLGLPAQLAGAPLRGHGQGMDQALVAPSRLWSLTQLNETAAALWALASYLLRVLRGLWSGLCKLNSLGICRSVAVCTVTALHHCDEVSARRWTRNMKSAF